MGITPFSNQSRDIIAVAAKPLSIEISFQNRNENKNNRVLFDVCADHTMMHCYKNKWTVPSHLFQISFRKWHST